MKQEELTHRLSELGLTKKEIEVYLQIVQVGSITPTDLANKTGINRTTIYSVASLLMQKGFIEEDRTGTTKALMAASPERIIDYLDEKQTQLKEQQALAQPLVNALEELSQRLAYPVPKIRFIKEAQMKTFLYKQIDRWNESLVERGGRFLGFQDEAFVGMFDEWIQEYWKRAPEHISLDLFANKITEEDKRLSTSFPRRRMHTWNGDEPFTSTTWIMGDYIVMFSLKDEPNYLVELHDKRMAENYRTLFKELLSQKEKPSV
jgi:sugar-specific transcriptional regulator TrmB